MTIRDKITLFLHKDECIRAVILDGNRRAKYYIVRINDENMFALGERMYVIDPKSVYIMEGLPTYFYYLQNPTPLTKEELKKVDEKLNPISAEKIKDSEAPVSPDGEEDDEEGINSAELYDAIEETISSRIMRFATEGDKKIINTILLMNILVMFINGLCTYLIYSQVAKVIEFITINEDMIEAIRQILINNGG